MGQDAAPRVASEAPGADDLSAAGSLDPRRAVRPLSIWSLHPGLLGERVMCLSWARTVTCQGLCATASQAALPSPSRADFRSWDVQSPRAVENLDVGAGGAQTLAGQLGSHHTAVDKTPSSEDGRRRPHQPRSGQAVTLWGCPSLQSHHALAASHRAES